MIDFQLGVGASAGTYRGALFVSISVHHITIRNNMHTIYISRLTPLIPSHWAGSPLITHGRERHDPWALLALRPLLWALEPSMHIALTPRSQSYAAPACLLLPCHYIWGPSFDCTPPECFRSLAASARKQIQNT
jgi:hypothetical protein